jgi:hypothetical protein
MQPNLLLYEMIVSKSTVLIDEKLQTHTHFEMKIDFIDSSVLHVNEVFTFRNSYLKYSYHWQTSDNQLIIRWDNAPHHPQISTFPHHKHIQTNENVVESTETDIIAVLDYISRNIQHS